MVNLNLARNLSEGKAEHNPYVVFMVMVRERCTYAEAVVHIFEARQIIKDDQIVNTIKS